MSRGWRASETKGKRREGRERRPVLGTGVEREAGFELRFRVARKDESRVEEEGEERKGKSGVADG